MYKNHIVKFKQNHLQKMQTHSDYQVRQKKFSTDAKFYLNCYRYCIYLYCLVTGQIPALHLLITGGHEYLKDENLNTILLTQILFFVSF
jgi:hypothetical protein